MIKNAIDLNLIRGKEDADMKLTKKRVKKDYSMVQLYAGEGCPSSSGSSSSSSKSGWGCNCFC